LRIGELTDSSLIATRVASIRQELCASPDYLRIRVPQSRHRSVGAWLCSDRRADAREQLGFTPDRPI